MLICAVLFSLHILVIDHFSPLVDGVKMSCIQFLVCGILSGLPALLFESPDLAGILAAKVPILYAGVMSCGVAYTLQIVGQKGMNDRSLPDPQPGILHFRARRLADPWTKLKRP